VKTLIYQRRAIEIYRCSTSNAKLNLVFGLIAADVTQLLHEVVHAHVFKF
jgi:hypothetical protein